MSRWFFFYLPRVVLLLVMQEDGACIWLVRMFWSVQKSCLAGTGVALLVHCDGEFDLKFQVPVVVPMPQALKRDSRGERSGNSKNESRRCGKNWMSKKKVHRGSCETLRSLPTWIWFSGTGRRKMEGRVAKRLRGRGQNFCRSTRRCRRGHRSCRACRMRRGSASRTLAPANVIAQSRDGGA